MPLPILNTFMYMYMYGGQHVGHVCICPVTTASSYIWNELNITCIHVHSVLCNSTFQLQTFSHSQA